MSVIRSAYATSDPAALPRPGPTGMPCSRAWRMKSQTTRKYPSNPIEWMMPSSLSRRGQYALGATRRARPSARRRSSPCRDSSSRYVLRQAGRPAPGSGAAAGLPSGKRHVAALGDLGRPRQHAGDVGEEPGHLLARLDVELVVVGVVPGQLGDGLVLADADQHPVRLDVLAQVEVAVVGGDQRDPRRLAPSRTTPSRAVRSSRQAVLLHLEEEAVAARGSPGTPRPPGRRPSRRRPAASTQPRPTGTPTARSRPRRAPRAAPCRCAAGGRNRRGRPWSRAASGCPTRAGSRPAARGGGRACATRTGCPRAPCGCPGATYTSHPSTGRTPAFRAAL